MEIWSLFILSEQFFPLAVNLTVLALNLPWPFFFFLVPVFWNQIKISTQENGPHFKVALLSPDFYSLCVYVCVCTYVRMQSFWKVTIISCFHWLCEYVFPEKAEDRA